VPILLIDNFDSFVMNVYQRIGEINSAADVRVVRNDAITVEEAEAMGPSHLIISPGPCTPKEAGCSAAMVRHFGGRIPVLGVCLGHQVIGDMHGMTVTRHAIPVHGKTSEIRHDGKGVFKGLSDPFVATRYHSLVVLADTVPAGWEVSAWTDEPVHGRVVMGLRRVWPGGGKRAPLEGVQFHPESFLTVEGPRLLKNFLEST